MAEVRAKLAPGTPIEVWCQDEMRVGQKNKLTYRWARKGSRPRAIHDQRTQSTYLFGEVCPERGAGAALVLPACNSEAMQLHLDEIATKVTPGAHAIVLLDQAGWHGAKALKVPSNISLLLLPPRAPELNGQENVWQFMRQNWLSNRIFKSRRPSEAEARRAIGLLDGLLEEFPFVDAPSRSTALSGMISPVVLCSDARLVGTGCWNWKELPVRCGCGDC